MEHKKCLENFFDLNALIKPILPIQASDAFATISLIALENIEDPD